MNYCFKYINLAWIILRTRRFKFVQMKSLGSQMTTPLVDIVLCRFICQKPLKIFS